MKIIGKKEYLKYLKVHREFEYCICEENEEYSFESQDKEYEKINNIHDKMFRDLLSDKEELVVFLKKYLDFSLDENDIENYSTNYITKTYKNVVSDIVYKIKNKNVFILIEHQSKVDYNMLIRLMEYSIEIIRKSKKNRLYAL